MQFKILRTPKFYMILFLFILTIIGAIKYGADETIPQLLAALITGIVLDLLINYLKERRILFPSSAIITGLLIATGISIETKIYIPAVLTAIAIISKHLIKINNKHIFNPANFGLLIGILSFSKGIQWWAADALWLVIPFGIFLTYKVRKYSIVISYAITHLIISLILFAFTKNLQYLYLLNIFFVLFMLIEPITSPTTKKGKIIFGAVFASLVFILQLLTPQLDTFILSLSVANAFVPLLNKLN
ncbi:MAG TPA: RnfABCDGE type electron transport complex subunit D [Candidatus Nanoarchaeia archaeon]|nr:RnfABCDGE type electron transport complex subunit D [Candidatus Nanoarchaeia archaeon]